MQTKDPLLPRPPSSEELERVRETLRRAESSYELLFEQAAEGIYFTDLSGVIDAANPRFCAMLGRAQGEVVGTSCGDFQGREDRRLLPERLAAVRAMRTLRGERALERADGSSFVAEVSSQLLPNDRILVMVRDITERKRAEEALRRSEANLQAVLAGNPDAVVVHVRGVVRFANPAALALLETASGEILGTRVVEWIHEGAVDVTLERIEASNRAGTALPPWECKMLRRRGGPVEAEARAIGVTFDGEPAILLVVRDIRERKRVERQLLVAERMASVGALAAGVAHEINNPLFYLTMNLEDVSARLAEHASGGVPAAVVGELRAALDAASEGARRVCEIVKGLKTFSRIDDDAREPVDIRRAVALALTMGESSMRHRATLRRSLQPVPLVSASEARLGQVVLNLLVNAAQSIPEGGRAADHEIAVATFVDDEGRVVIEVRDTGTGIQPDVLGRIFEPFFTTKAVGAGTGLGLSICHGIVRGLGGHISVETKVGVGSTFRVSLPAASPAAPAQNVPVSAAPSLRGRVLVIDDEPMIGVSLRRILGAAHDVETFTRAQDALEHIRGGARFDVILCDVMMPSMTGMDAYDAVHALDSDQASRMVFLTGGAFTDRSRAFVDAHRVMNKPVAVKQIRELVAEFVARARSGRSGSAPRV